MTGTRPRDSSSAAIDDNAFAELQIAFALVSRASESARKPTTGSISCDAALGSPCETMLEMCSARMLRAVTSVWRASLSPSSRTATPTGSRFATHPIL